MAIVKSRSFQLFLSPRVACIVRKRRNASLQIRGDRLNFQRVFSVDMVELEATNACGNSNNQTEQTARLNRANRSVLVDQWIYASINTWLVRSRGSQYIEINPH